MLKLLRDRIGVANIIKSVKTSVDNIARRRRSSTAENGKKKVVILGSGWAGYRLQRDLNKQGYKVLVVSPRNHFLFTPLLPSTATGVLDFRSIVEPLRTHEHDIEYYQASVTNIDPVTKKISCEENYRPEVKFDVNYDKLIVAVGAENNTFGIPGVREHAFFLKELSDARKIRQKIIANFEEASIPDISPEERNRLLKFVVVGGGPTGVEFAAEVADFLREDLRRYYPDLPHHEVQITLLEAGHTILTSFNRVLVEKAMKSLKKQGVELLTDNPVAEVREKDVVLRDGTVMPCGIVVWSTGVGPRPIIRKLTWPKTRQGRLHVDEYLKVKDLDDVWAMGDCAEIEGHPLPATAQVAEQQGRYLAKSFNGDLQNVERKPFAFRFLGMMTYIGNYSTLMDTKMISGTGFIEWFAWRSVYLTRLGSLRNKFQVPYNWLRTLIWGRDVSNF